MGVISDIPIHARLSRRLIRCGRARCPTCTEGGEGHGPYWFAHWQEDGKPCQRYIGRRLPANVREEQVRDLTLSYAEMLTICRVCEQAGKGEIARKIGGYIETRTRYSFLARAVPDPECKKPL